MSRILRSYVLTVAVVLLVMYARVSSAADVAATCGTLQAALDAAVDGDVITLQAGSVCTGTWTLPDVLITLQGGGTGATLDGAGSGPILTGSNLPGITIRTLTFQNGKSAMDGGAVQLSLCSTTRLENNTFSQNSAQNGGALSIVPGCGGSPSVTVILTGNSFTSNVAAQSGGGASIDSWGFVKLSQNTFSSNTAVASGGGAFILGLDVSTLNDRFTSNSIASGNGAAFVVGRASMFDAQNLVSSGNVITVGGRGAGAFFDTASGASLTMEQATVVNNTTGVGANVPARLALYNSIVYGNGATDLAVTDFASTDVQSSDLCVSGSPAPGSGNICANPVLTGVHETAASPTLDAGNDSLVPATLTTDFEGDPRIQDSNGDGVAHVDMGADEAPPLVVAPPSHDRTVTLKLSGHLKARGQLTVTDGFAPCRGSAMVLIERSSGNQWVPAGSATTNADGAYSARLSDVQGDYRARAPQSKAGTDTCGEAISATSKYSHRGDGGDDNGDNGDDNGGDGEGGDGGGDGEHGGH